MKRSWFLYLISVVFIASILFAAEENPAEIRLVNGRVIKGEILAISEEGLELKTPQGSKLFRWETLSLGTRYRYQASFRENFDAIQKGQVPLATTTNQVLSSKQK